MDATVNQDLDHAFISFSPTLFFGWLAGFLPIEIGPIWIPAAIERFHASSITIGMTASAQYLISALVALIVAPRIARRSPERALQLGLGIILLTTLLTCLFAQTLVVFVVLRILEGAGAGLCIATGGMIASSTPRPRLSFTILQVAQTLASMAVFAMGGTLLSAFGFTGLYAVVLTMGLIALASLLIQRRWASMLILRGAPLRSSRSRWPVRVACVGVAIIYCAFIGMVTNASAFSDRAMLSLGQLGLVLAVSAPFSALGSLSGALLGTRLSSRWLIVISASGALAAGLFLAFLSRDFISFAAALAAYCFSIYIGVPTIFASIGRAGGGGSAAASAQAAQFIGLAFGPIIGALLAHGSVIALALGGGLGVVAGVALSFGVTQRLIAVG